jgi:thymidylate synthase (FAD)
MATQIYTKTVEESRQAYDALLAAGVSREQARGVLPPCMYTSFVWTCSLQALLHFISLRIGEGAQSEIAAYAEALLKLADPIAPEVFETFAENNYQF